MLAALVKTLQLSAERTLLHHRKEAWLRHLENFAQPPRLDAAGVVLLLFQSKNHPGFTVSGCFAAFLDRSATLLAPMQGGTSVGSTLLLQFI
jgi:hypothetical protein